MPETNVITLHPPVDDPKPKGKLKPREAAAQHLQSALATGVRGALRDAIQAALDIAASPRRRDLTEVEYQALKPGQKLVDHSRPGFLARANRHGTRFIYRHRDPDTDRQRETAIGYLRDITLADARTRWETMRAHRMAGNTPDQTGKPAATALPTVGDLATRYLEEYAEKVKRSWRDDQRLLKRHVLPEHGAFQVDEFTHDVIAGLLAGMADTPREAQKLRAVLSAMFNVAVGRTKKMVVDPTWLPRTFANPVVNVTAAEHKPQVHEPTGGEILRYAAGLRELDVRPDITDALELQLLCMSRVSEVTSMEWSEVDLEHGEWRLPAERSKNGEPHLVLLSRQAVAILERRRGFATKGAKYVFPAPTSHQRPLRSDRVQHTLADNREALGVDKRFTSHNVRHAATTWAAEAEYPVEVVNRCTAHIVATGINARYNFAKLNKPAAELWQAWADHLYA